MRPTLKDQNNPDLRTLVTFAPCFGVRSPSPFTLKTEALLKMADLPYQCRFGTPQDGPRGKLPVLIDGGRVIADSRFIRRHLETTSGVDFDEGLDDGQRAHAVALQRVCEEHLYWAQTYFRWTDYYPLVRDNYFGSIPRPLRDAVGLMARRQVRRDLRGHGLGRMTRDEIVALATEDLRALARQLGDQDFMFGHRPTALDATAYGLIANILVPDLPSPIAEVAEDLFADYVQRFAAEVMGSSIAKSAAAPRARALPMPA